MKEDYCFGCINMKCTYPEPIVGEMKSSHEISTHRVELKELRPVPTKKIITPTDVLALVKEMGDYDREYFTVIHLDTKNRVIGIENISKGTLNAALVHPREVSKGAILNNAAGVILIHNHPSGIPEPSREDDLIVSRLIQGFSLLGIDVLDGIIIGKEGYYSYKEVGKLPDKGTGTGDKVMEEKDDKCSIALKAAMSTVKEYCEEEGETEVDIGGVKIRVLAPETVMQVMEEPDLTYEQRVKAIQESSWATGEAEGLCGKLFGAPRGSEEFEKCVERVSRRLAEGMVGRTTKQSINKERREERISSEKMWD